MLKGIWSSVIGYEQGFASLYYDVFLLNIVVIITNIAESKVNAHHAILFMKLYMFSTLGNLCKIFQ